MGNDKKWYNFKQLFFSVQKPPQMYWCTVIRINVINTYMYISVMLLYIIYISALQLLFWNTISTIMKIKWLEEVENEWA